MTLTDLHEREAPSYAGLGGHAAPAVQHHQQVLVHRQADVVLRQEVGVQLAVAAVAGAITPVPGGIGPLTIAMLLIIVPLSVIRRSIHINCFTRTFS